MDSLLDALQEGRLIELPDHNKDQVLKFLAHIIEAIPWIPPNTDVVGLVMAREILTNTALGKGWACPHARVILRRGSPLRCRMESGGHRLRCSGRDSGIHYRDVPCAREPAESLFARGFHSGQSLDGLSGF